MADRIVKVILRGDVAGFKASMAAASKSVSDTADRMTGAEKQSAKFRQGLTSVGDTAGKVGLVAAAGLGAVVVATANFDQAMSNVQAATHETAANMDRLREAAIQAGADTSFSASEAAAGIENLAKAGVSTADILGGGLNGALDLAAAGGMEVADAAEVAATALTQFGLSGQDVPHVADLLAAAAGKAQGDVSDMSMALKQSGLVAAQMGLSLEETTGTLAAFASAGLLGSDAGTSFRTMLLRLANPTQESAELMERLGINAYDAQGQFVGMESLAGQLQTAFQGQTQAQRDAAMATLFGSDAIRASAILYSQGSAGIADWTSKVDDSGYAAETAATRLDNLKGDLEALKGSLETALIGSGEGSQGALRGLVQGMTDVVNAYNKLPPAAQGATTAILGVTAVAGGGLWAFSKIVTGISDTRAALANLPGVGGKASAALKGVGKAAGIAGIALAGFAAADAVSKIGDEGLPGLEALTSQLIDLANASTASSLSSEFDSLGESIDRLADKNTAQKINDSLADMIGMGHGRAFREAKAEVDALDAALADLVTSGHADVAASALKNLGLSGSELEQLTPLLTGYEEALAGVENDAKLAASATDQFGAATGDATGAIEDNTDALQDNIDAMREKRSEAIRAANAEIDYQASLDDARAALKENGRTLDITTEKGRANRSALLAVAAAWNDQSDAAKSAPGAHRAASRSFVDLAVKMGMSRAEARALAREILEIPSKRVNVTVDTGQAQSELVRVQGLINAVPRYIGVTIEAQRRGNWSGSGPGLATGGYVSGPGTATSDSIPAYLSNGEYVVKAAAVQKYGKHMFDRLNSMRFANGGYVQPRRYARGGDVEPLTARDFRQFNMAGDLGVRGIRDELREFARAVKDAGGDWTKAMDKMSKQAVSAASAYAKSAKRLDDLRAARGDLMSGVRDNFNNDPFGNGLSGAFLQLEADANDANQQTAEMRRLRRLGLDGSAFRALADSGDLNTMSQINTRAEVRRLERLYAQRASAQAGAARYAGEAEFGKQIRSQNRLITRLEKKLDRLEGAVERGARAGVGDRDRRTSQRKKAGR